MFEDIKKAMDQAIAVLKELIAILTDLINGFKSKKPIEDEDFTWITEENS